MKSFWLALQFLTLFRGPKNLQYTAQDFSGSLRWFFLIGLLIGSIQWIFSVMALKYHCPVPLAAIFVLMIGILCTGGLHIDGVADTADGFGAGTDRESVLRIMKDDRIGVYGITAIFLNLFLKIIALFYVLNSKNLIVIMISPMLSRAFLTATCTILPYARKEGTGKAFSEGSFIKHAFPSLLLSGAICCYLLRIPGLLIFAFVAGVSLFFSLYCYFKIKGFTGDTLGAQNEIAEITALLAGAFHLVML